MIFNPSGVACYDLLCIFLYIMYLKLIVYNIEMKVALGSEEWVSCVV